MAYIAFPLKQELKRFPRGAIYRGRKIVYIPFPGKWAFKRLPRRVIQSPILEIYFIVAIFVIVIKFNLDAVANKIF